MNMYEGNKPTTKNPNPPSPPTLYCVQQQQQHKNQMTKMQCARPATPRSSLAVPAAAAPHRRTPPPAVRPSHASVATASPWRWRPMRVPKVRNKRHRVSTFLFKNDLHLLLLTTPPPSPPARSTPMLWRSTGMAPRSIAHWSRQERNGTVTAAAAQVCLLFLRLHV